MDEGELDCSIMVQSASMDCLFKFDEEVLKDTHAWSCTCNPPGPDDSSHTHTCFHVHTKISPQHQDTAEKKKSDPIEKQFANTARRRSSPRGASLEDEVVKLRALNQHLVKRLQGQGALEAQIARLKWEGLKGRLDPSPFTITNLLIQTLTCLLLLLVSSILPCNLMHCLLCCWS